MSTVESEFTTALFAVITLGPISSTPNYFPQVTFVELAQMLLFIAALTHFALETNTLIFVVGLICQILGQAALTAEAMATVKKERVAA